MKLDIRHELYFRDRFYYVDYNQNWYRIANNIKVPNSPLVSYNKFNDSSYYIKLDEERDSKLIDSLDNELIRSIEDLLDDD